MQDNAARHQERQTGSTGDELREASSRLAQVLDVVQNEQELLWCDGGGERVERGFARIVRDAESAGNRGYDKRVIAQWRELHEETPFANDDPRPSRAGSIANSSSRCPPRR